MKITEIKTILTSPNQNYLFVKIETDSGLYGVGDASLNGREQTVADLIETYLKPLLIGHDAQKIEDIWNMIYRGSYWRGGNIMMSALSGIDIALWDILGKSAGKPLYALFGGKTRERVLCYSHVLGETNEEKISRAAAFVKEKGYKVIRLRAGKPAACGTFGTDKSDGPLIEEWTPEDEMQDAVDYFRRVREQVGWKTGIIYDLHERFSPEQAVRVMRKLEEYDPYFIEDPISPECAESLRSVREKTICPIAFGELYKSRAECIPAVINRWIDYLRCDIIRIGGITEARKLGALAELFDVKTAWHGPNDVSPITHAVNWHLNVSAPNFGIQEDGSIDGLIQEVIKGGPVYRDGYLYMEDVPGVGCDIDEEAAAKYPFKKAYLPYCRKSDGSVTPW